MSRGSDRRIADTKKVSNAHAWLVLVPNASSYDPTPSILKHPLYRTSTDQHISKRPKHSTAPDHAEDIESRIKCGGYSSMEELVDDVDTAASSLLTAEQPSPKLPNGHHHQHTDEILPLQITAFRKVLNKYLLNEALREPTVKAEEVEADEKVFSAKGFTNEDRDSRTVLTLYGSAPGPRQLFSSLQRPTHVPIKEPDSTISRAAVDVFTTLREELLPNGITTTKIVPYNVSEPSRSKTSNPTFGEIFKPRSNLRPLEPPKQSKHNTRSSSVSWINRSDPFASTKAKGSEKNYKYTTLPTGHWLHYHSSPTPAHLISSEAKRKQRDRALSSSDTKTDTKPADAVDIQGAKDAALFRSAYSSFGPTCDNAAAIVPESTRSQVWWDRIGSKRSKALYAVQYPVEDLVPIDASIKSLDLHAETEAFEKAVDAFVPEDAPQEFLVGPKSGEDIESKEVEHVLHEISELLETLHSHHRIRNLSTSSAQSTVSQSADFKSTAPTPTDPSTAEFDVYEMLKTNLSLMVASLPPYAVAKLNGGQLEDLNISTKILIADTNYPGTMEEDEYTVYKNRPTLVAASTPAARISTPNAIVAGRPGNYQTPGLAVAQLNQRAHLANARPAPTAGSYQPQSYQNARPSMPGGQFSSSSTPQSFTNSRPPASTAPRPSYNPHHYPTSSNVPYTQSSALQQFQRSAQNGYGPNYPTQPNTSTAGYQQRPGQPGYAQRAQDSAAYGAVARSASPQKPSSYNTPQAPPPRPGYATNGTPAVQPRYFQQQAPQYGSHAYSSTTPGPFKSQTPGYDARSQGSSTPQPLNGQHAGPDRSVTPVGGGPNGTPVAAGNGQ